MNDFKKELDVAVDIARKGGKIMLEYFDADQKVEIKADNSQVTIADKMINSLVIEELAKSFPEDGVIGEEESNASYGMGRKWICDPIDGTAGFIYGCPTAMFSLALVVDGKPKMGVAYDPFLDKLYTGVAEGPSVCNGKVISVSDLDIKSGRFAVSGSIRSLPTTKYYMKMVDDKIPMVAFGGAVYKGCLIAKGKLVGYIEEGINPHDIAAVHVIIENAGGKVTAVDGSTLNYSKPFKGAILSNGVAHDALVEYCK